jgi:hypothetical protein
VCRSYTRQRAGGFIGAIAKGRGTSRTADETVLLRCRANERPATQPRHFSRRPYRSVGRGGHKGVCGIRRESEALGKGGGAGTVAKEGEKKKGYGESLN